MLEFFNFLNSIHPLSPEATAALMKVIKMKELRKGQVWLQEGAVCDKFTFVIKGLLKLYFDHLGKELVLGVSAEREPMISSQSYLQSSPSRYAIRSVEPTVILYLGVTDLHRLVELYPELNRHFMLIAEAEILKLEKHMALLLLPARERWEYVKRSETLLNDGARIPDKLLAAYLGVAPNAVSRYRRAEN